ncbi:MAG: DUF72 domain-containing protein [Granulicella sp.]
MERYSRTFSACEINSSFYRPHRPATWQRWAASVPEDFRFSVKAPKAITHDAALDIAPAQLDSFLEQVQNLGSKLGPLLFQLPPKAVFRVSRAAGFLTLLRERYTAAVVFEPRHPSWFTREAEDLLRSFNVARVAADPAAVPEAATPGGSTALCYYRLHGSPRIYYSSYAQEFLESLAASLAAQPAAAEVWCIFDNTALGAAIENAQQMRRLISYSV